MLAGIWENILRLGPRDGDERAAAIFVCNAKVIDRSLQIYNRAFPACDGWEATTEIHAGTIRWACAITVPRPAQLTRLIRAAKREWDRFCRCLLTHENGHVPKYRRELEVIAGEVEALRGHGTGRPQ